MGQRSTASSSSCGSSSTSSSYASSRSRVTQSTVNTLGTRPKTTNVAAGAQRPSPPMTGSSAPIGQADHRRGDLAGAVVILDSTSGRGHRHVRVVHACTAATHAPSNMYLPHSCGTASSIAGPGRRRLPHGADAVVLRVVVSRSRHRYNIHLHHPPVDGRR